MKKRILIISSCIILGVLTVGILKHPDILQRIPPEDSAQEGHSQEQAAPEQAAPSEEEVREKAVVHILNQLTLEQKVGQLFFARCPDGAEAETAAQYEPGGYILFSRDVKSRTPETLGKLIGDCQSAVTVPLLVGVDEEGGTVCRLSRFPQYRESPFLPPQKLYQLGGMEAIRADTEEKSELLRRLNINVNFAPVCDVSTDARDFINARSFGKDAEQTASYVSEVVEVMQKNKIGCVLKHFPGYGDNKDTHAGSAVDKRSFSQFQKSDFLPFEAGIAAGAGAVMVSHNIVESMDAERPASLSPAVQKILRGELGFEGVSLTDDLAMDAIQNHTNGISAAVMAIAAGNDMVLSSNLPAEYAAVLSAAKNGTLSEERIRQACMRVLNWKYDLGMLN